jgi:uncharacterized membrane protein YdbT with pleckstrin-like domain
MGKCAKCGGWKPDDINFGYRHQVCSDCQRQDAFIAATRNEAKRAAKDAARAAQKEAKRQLKAQKWAVATAEAKEAEKQLDKEIQSFWRSVRNAMRHSFFGSRVGGLCGLVIIALLIRLAIWQTPILLDSHSLKSMGFWWFAAACFAGAFLLFLGFQFFLVCIKSLVAGKPKAPR